MSTWAPFSGINDDPQYLKWMGTVQDGTPDGPKLHSIIVDPRDPAHLYFAMSGGGVHESVDGGRTWTPLVDGLEVVEGFDPADLTFHDPHCVRLCPSNPDRLYQQNHCGIYRIDRPSKKWVRIGKAMPKRVGDVGFPMVVHPRDADTAWVFPMDGLDRVAAHQPGGHPGGLRDAQRRPDLAAARFRHAGAPGVVDGEAPGDDRGRTRPGRPVLRDDERRAVDEPRRRPPLVVHGAAPAGDLRGGSRGAGAGLTRRMRVLIPSSLRSYTQRSQAEASGATLAEALADLDRPTLESASA